MSHTPRPGGGRSGAGVRFRVSTVEQGRKGAVLMRMEAGGTLGGKGAVRLPRALFKWSV